VFDRALADPIWVRARLDELNTSGPRRAKQWGIAAFARADLHVRWTVTVDRAAASALEDRLVAEAGAPLWNRAGLKLAATPTAPPGPDGRAPGHGDRA